MKNSFMTVTVGEIIQRYQAAETLKTSKANLYSNYSFTYTRPDPMLSL